MSLDQNVKALFYFYKKLKPNFKERKFSISQEREHPNRTDPENRKHNYNHALPTLIDNNAQFSVFESHSILRYLAEKFFPHSHWYPSDLKTRTRINNFLDWHTVTIRHSFMVTGLAYLPGYTREGVDKSKALVQLAQDAWFGSNSHLWKDRADNGLVNQLRVINDRWLQGSAYLAGDELSIADLSLYGDTGYLIHIFGFDFKDYPNLNKWYNKMEEQFGNLPARLAYIPMMKTFGGLFKDVFPVKGGGPSSITSHPSSSNPKKKMINYGDEDVPYRPIPTRPISSHPQPSSFQSPSKISDHGSVEFSSPQPERQTFDQEQAKEFNDASHWSQTHEENLPDFE